MPFSTLTDEQILELLAEQPKMLAIPGVASVWVEFTDVRRRQTALGVTVYAGNQQAIGRLPRTVAGLPILVRVEDARTGRVLEVIDTVTAIVESTPSPRHNSAQSMERR